MVSERLDTLLRAVDPLHAALVAAVVCGLAELVHARRVARVARLAFGERAAPRPWVGAAPLIRALACAGLAWSLFVLYGFRPPPKPYDPDSEPAQHLLVAWDASPSMYLRDAGPSGEQSRAERAADLVETILERLDTATTRVSVVAFYTDAKPVVLETFDMDVVRNVLRGLPLEHAFDVGQTRLQEGVEAAMTYAKAWPADSAALLVVSDGDTLPGTTIADVPRSIADCLVLGVGHPHRGSPIAGRTSRQDGRALEHLAVRLGGVYHDGNVHHLPSRVLRGLSMAVPELAEAPDLRDLALAVAGLATLLLALLPLALARFGSPVRGRDATSSDSLRTLGSHRAPGRPAPPARKPQLTR